MLSSSASSPPPPPPQPPRWTEEDEVRLLRASLEFATEPVESFDPTVSPFLRMETALAGRGFTCEEILNKIKELRSRYELARRDAGDGGGAVFEISQKIWGRASGEESEVHRGGGDKTEEREERKEETAVKKGRNKRKRRKIKSIKSFL